MEKISGIVPSSARVKAVDLKTSGPLRPGVPSFGRPIGVATASAKDQMTTAQKAIYEHNKLVEGRRGEEFNSAIARDITQRFFQEKASDIAAPLEGELSPPESLIEAPIAKKPLALAEKPAALEPMQDDDLDAPEVGRFLNVSV